MSEWMIEEGTGKRYRLIGNNIKEYETYIQSSSGRMIPESQWKEYLKCEEEARKQRILKEAEEIQKKPTSFCPWLSLKNNNAVLCSDECSFYCNGCSMKGTEAPRGDTKGKKCPYMRICTEKCSMYENGCTL